MTTKADGIVTCDKKPQAIESHTLLMTSARPMATKVDREIEYLKESPPRMKSNVTIVTDT